MRIAIGVDWSDQAFTTVTQTFHTYHPSDATLVHGVDLGMFESPIVAQAANLQGDDDFRNAMVDAGKQLLHRAEAMIPSDIGNVRRINEIGSPPQIILNAAKTVAADLIVVGPRGTEPRDRSRARQCLPSRAYVRLLPDLDCERECQIHSTSACGDRRTGRRWPDQEVDIDAPIQGAGRTLPAHSCSFSADDGSVRHRDAVCGRPRQRDRSGAHGHPIYGQHLRRHRRTGNNGCPTGERYGSGGGRVLQSKRRGALPPGKRLPFDCPSGTVPDSGDSMKRSLLTS